MKTEGHIKPTRTVIEVDTHNYPTVEVAVLIEFDPPEDPAKAHGERYFRRKKITIEGHRFCPTHHHQRALVFETLSRIFREFHLDAMHIGALQETENAQNESNDDNP